MEVKFRTSDKGLGLFLDLNIEISTNNIIVDEKIDNDVYFAFDNSIASGFKPGIYFIKKAILDNIEQINNHFKCPITIKLISVDSNPAHYQDEAFYGATILFLNRMFNLSIQEPKYAYDSVNKKFEIRQGW